MNDETIKNQPEVSRSQRPLRKRPIDKLSVEILKVVEPARFAMSDDLHVVFPSKENTLKVKLKTLTRAGFLTRPVAQKYLDPSKLEHKDKDLLWREADKPAKPILTEDWLVRDVGPLKRIRVKLAAEGRFLEVQIPTQPDLRPFY